ncbi:MAG: DoxX family protein [Bacteroidetes bacterium]|nr:DoxX family protein [Bacteroidota bacterium]
MTKQTSLPLKIVASLLCILIGAVFVFSGWSKIPTLEQFGWTIVETTPLNWTLAEWSARLLIGLELFLGVLFIFHIRLRTIAIPISIGLLLIFTLYLLMVIKTYGSSGNCGCFGELIQMTPLESVIKNLIMLVIIVIIYFIQHELKFKYLGLLSIVLLLLCIAFPIWRNPPESIYISEKEPDINEPLPLSMLYESANNPPPGIELRKGKHVIAFMSLTCEFCRKAAKRMRIMKQKHPELPFFIILNGDSSQIKPFFDDTKVDNIDYSIFNGAEQFKKLNRGTALPTIKWMKDTTLIRESNYITLDEDDILKWMKEK